MPHIETTLMLHSTKDGPWVPVRRLVRIMVKGATRDDALELQFADHDLQHQPEPLRFSGSGEYHLNFPKGKVKVARVTGTEPVTVFGYCLEYL